MLCRDSPRTATQDYVDRCDVELLVYLKWPLAHVYCWTYRLHRCCGTLYHVATVCNASLPALGMRRKTGLVITNCCREPKSILPRLVQCICHYPE
jgi:hypothetical protein